MQGIGIAAGLGVYLILMINAIVLYLLFIRKNNEICKFL